MASSRHKGTNEIIATYGDATRNYTVLATWEADTDYDLVGSSISFILECYNDATYFNDYVTMNGATTNSSYFRIIRPASEQGHIGTPNIGVRFFCTTDINVLLINETYSQIQDIIAQLFIASTNNRTCFGSSAVGGGAFIGDIAFYSQNTGTGLAHGFGLGNVNNVKFINCLACNNEGSGFATAAVAGGNNFYYNCSSVNNSGRGFANDFTAYTQYYRNSLAKGNAVDFLNSSTGFMNVSYCASSDATANDWGGLANRINQIFGFINESVYNFHLTLADTGAKNYGTDLSADSVYAFNDDINNGTMGAGKAGETRPWGSAWDIGFDEYTGMPDRWHPSIEQPYIQKNEIVGY